MEIQLFASPIDVLQRTPIDGNVDSDKLNNVISKTQDTQVQDVLGTDLYRRLQEGIKNEDLNDNEKLLINDYIIDMLVHWTACEFIRVGTYNISNAGIVKNQPQDTIAASRNEIADLAQNMRDYGNRYKQRLVDYLCYNSNLYTEYSTNTGSDIHPSKKVDYSGGWFLS